MAALATSNPVLYSRPWRRRNGTKVSVIIPTYNRRALLLGAVESVLAQEDCEPEVIEPLGTPPAGWQAGAKALWHEMVACAPEDVLTKADRHLMEIAVRLLAQIRSDSEVKASTASQFRACLSEMGMTPSARSRLYSGGHPGAANPFAALD